MPNLEVPKFAHYDKMLNYFLTGPDDSLYSSVIIPAKIIISI